MKNRILTLIMLCMLALNAMADYTLTGLQDLWNTSVSGNTITFTSAWGGGGWYLTNMDCSDFSSVEVTFASAAAQAGNLQVYYNGENSPSTKVDFAAGETSVTAQLESSMKSSVEKIAIACGSGSITISSGKLISEGGSGSGSGSGTITTGDHGFIVSGTQLLDAKNNPFRPVGANFAWAWYRHLGYATPLTQMANQGANCVRVVMANGNQYTKEVIGNIRNIISKCESLSLVAILEVHDATGSDSQTDLQAAADFWVEMASALQGHEHTVIINIANEWMGTWNQGNNYRNAYTAAITTIRNAGLHHCLMVDAPGWGQDVSTLSLQCSRILQADPDQNVMFSIHMYGTAGASSVVVSNINSVLQQNCCLVIGEYGWYHTDGDVDEDLIISQTASTGVGQIAWSWYGNGGSVSYLDMVSDNNDASTTVTQYSGSYSCNWGQKVMASWSDAELCTVFTDAPAANPDTTTQCDALRAEQIVESTRVADHVMVITAGPVMITDCLGRLVYMGQSNGSLYIDACGWANGTYLLRVGNQTAVKLVK